LKWKEKRLEAAGRHSKFKIPDYLLRRIPYSRFKIQNYNCAGALVGAHRRVTDERVEQGPADQRLISDNYDSRPGKMVETRQLRVAERFSSQKPRERVSNPKY
jgi:hypothetical protein